MGRQDRATLVRICDQAGRTRGAGFVADRLGTVVTSHETVDGLDRIVLVAPDGRARAVGTDAVTALPGDALALIRAEGLGVRPLPLASRTAETGTYVRIEAHGWREARVLGTTRAAYPGGGGPHPVGDAVELAIGTEGREALWPGGEAGGGPVLDAATGAVLAVVATTLRTDHPAALAVPLAAAAARDPAGPLAALLRRNAATVPAHGPDLNLAGALQLTALTHPPLHPAHTVHRPAIADHLALFTRPTGHGPGASGRYAAPSGPYGESSGPYGTGGPLVCALVGEPGSGRTTALAALARRRATGSVPEPTLWLRGADLRPGDTSLADAVGRVLHRADRTAAPADGERGAYPRAHPAASAGRLARTAGQAGRPLLVVLDAPEEAPPPFADRLPHWTSGTVGWLRQHGVRLALACGPAYWETAGPLYPPGALHGHGALCEPGTSAPAAVPVGDLTREEAEEARARYGLLPGALAAADARHPLALRLLADLRAAVPGAVPPGVGRADLFAAHLNLRCLRVARRIAAGCRPALSEAEVRGLAARVAGRVHEAARRCLGPCHGALDRAAFEELFPGDTRWASAVLAEGLLVAAGTGYRFADEEFGEWLQAVHLDVDATLDALVLTRHEATAPPDHLPATAPRGAAARTARPAGAPLVLPAGGTAPALPPAAPPPAALPAGGAPVREATPIAGTPGPATPPAAHAPGPVPAGPASAGPVLAGRVAAASAYPAGPDRSAVVEYGPRPGHAVPPGERTAAGHAVPPGSGGGARAAAAVPGRVAPPWPEASGPAVLSRSDEPPGLSAVPGLVRAHDPLVQAPPPALSGRPAPEPLTPEPLPFGPLGPGPSDPEPPAAVPPGHPAGPGAARAPHPERPVTRAAGVPAHRVGVVVRALLLLERGRGTGALARRLERLLRREPGPADAEWWAGRLLRDALLAVDDARPYTGVLRLLAARLTTRPAPGDPDAYGPSFWERLRLGEDERLDLLRRVLPADVPRPARPGTTRSSGHLAAVARHLAADPRGVQPLLCRWFTDERPLPAQPGSPVRPTVAGVAQALLRTHRDLAVDDLCEALVTTAHPRADELLAGLVDDDPAALCRAVDRWAHDDARPARRVAAATYGPLLAARVTADTDRELLRFAALALLARPGDRSLHGAALTVLVHDPRARAQHMPQALTLFRAGDRGLRARSLTTALTTHPEPVLAAFRTRLLGGDHGAAADVLDALAEVHAPALVRRAAALVREYADRRPEGAAHAAAYIDRRLEQGPAAHIVHVPLVMDLLRGRSAEVRAALAPVLAAPGTDGSRAARARLLGVLLDVERDEEPGPAVPEALLRAVARGATGASDTRARGLVLRAGELLARTPDGAARLDRVLAELAGREPGFAARLGDWFATDPDRWAALAGPAVRRAARGLAAPGPGPGEGAAAVAGRAPTAMPMRAEPCGHGTLRPAYRS
ncbi:serine protease [Streptomyces sp. enrichment culture]|uniref:serine protease n=1 Tax=Streptomyces sp. enrichment culture TaxID=1795815 RepID=UPI003F5792E4